MRLATCAEYTKLDQEVMAAVRPKLREFVRSIRTKQEIQMANKELKAARQKLSDYMNSSCHLNTQLLGSLRLLALARETHGPNASDKQMERVQEAVRILRAHGKQLVRSAQIFEELTAGWLPEDVAIEDWPASLLPDGPEKERLKQDMEERAAAELRQRQEMDSEGLPTIGSPYPYC